MRLLVCGGRKYKNANWVDRVLNRALHKYGDSLVLIHGGAPGADTLAGEWADRSSVPCVVVPAPWKGMGKKAGPVRNAWMLKLTAPDLIVAFPGGDGTANMIEQATGAGVNIYKIREPK